MHVDCTRGLTTLTHSSLEISLTFVVWTYDTFENIFGMKQQFEKYLKESWRKSSDEQFSFKYFHYTAFVREISPKLSGLVWWPNLVNGLTQLDIWFQNVYEMPYLSFIMIHISLFYDSHGTIFPYYFQDGLKSRDKPVVSGGGNQSTRQNHHLTSSHWQLSHLPGPGFEPGQ